MTQGKAKVRCETCGSWAYLIWGGLDGINWTGSCNICGTIMFADKTEVIV